MQLTYHTYVALLCGLTVSSLANEGSAKLRGVSHSGIEYTCVRNQGIFEGPTDDKSIKKMKSWKVNIVRMPLNEDCWLGINGFNPDYTGVNYQTNVTAYVNRLRKHGLKVILDLHWSDGLYSGAGQGVCYNNTAICQKPMPDKKHAPAFWKSVAANFKHDQGVIFDIFNEPFPEQQIQNITAAWECLRDGGKACPGFQYEIAGIQDLVDAVRSTGAKNLIMVPGLKWTNDLSRWMEFVPKDPANNIAASWHNYNNNACNDTDCWDKNIAPIAKKYTIIAGELGEYDCTDNYVSGLMKWLDSKKIGYLAWAWNVWDCGAGPALITDYNGTPTEYGKGVRKHFRNRHFLEEGLL